MRVIAGYVEGPPAEGADWDGLRPTSDRLRETLFNVLAPRIAGRARAGRLCRHRRGRHRGAEPRRRARDVRRQRPPRAGADRREPGALRRSTTAMLLSARLSAGLSSTLDAAALGPYEPFDIVLLDPPYDDPADAGARRRRRARRARRRCSCSNMRAARRRRTRRAALARACGRCQRRFDAVVLEPIN